MVHEDGEGRRSAIDLTPKNAQQNIPRRHHGVGLIQMTRLGIDKFQHRGPIQQRDVDAASVGGVVVDVLVVRFAECGLLQDLAEDEGVLNLLQAYDVG